MNTCHARGCTVTVGPCTLMCARHWRQVPRKFKKQICRHFRRGEAVTQQASSVYRQAKNKAIDAVAAREGIAA